MSTSLGADWASNFSSFERLPFAAASIGQVHQATLAPTVSPTGQPEPVAVKIQFPNIVNSIDSDVGYIKLLLSAGKLLPKGLFLDRTIKVFGIKLCFPTTLNCRVGLEGGARRRVQLHTRRVLLKVVRFTCVSRERRQV
jgi:ABC1 atypical kinase-like domain